MPKTILDFDLIDDDDYSTEVQYNSGGAGSSKRRKNPMRADFDASGGAYPTAGLGSGDGIIIRGDEFPVTVTGSVPASGGGSASVTANHAILKALITNPGNDPDNWAILIF